MTKKTVNTKKPAPDPLIALVNNLTQHMQDLVGVVETIDTRLELLEGAQRKLDTRVVALNQLVAVIYDHHSSDAPALPDKAATESISESNVVDSGVHAPADDGA